MFIEYTTPQGKQYMLRAYQIGALEGNEVETRVYASVAGNAVIFRVKRPYADVARELRKAIETDQEAET